MSASSTAGAFPERVGKYEVLLPLGTGGTATVYLARTRGVAGFEREVALKLVHAHLRADEESRLHLLEEARLAARIRHPNVVPVTEVDSDAHGVFLVMEYVEGEALSGLVRLLRDSNHRLPTRLIARIMNDALAGLHAAHELRDSEGQLVGLVHRDFSPQNILVGIEGVARLADFGVAKAASRTVRTKTGLVKGKVAYMSPEQARGHKVDRRCDVWAAGVVVWELVTGRKLYDHEDDVATLLSVVTEEPPRLGTVLQGVPASLDDAVAYALTSDVGSRCPSAETFRQMLESAWDECGGMASTTELGAFVRQTVGHRLAERRTLAQRGRTSHSGEPALPGSPFAAVAAASAEAAPREDGTKTAISAAVPAAERLGTPTPLRAWRRSTSIAVGMAAAAVALSLGIAFTGSGEAVQDKAVAAPSPAPPAATPVPAPAAPGLAERSIGARAPAPDTRAGASASEPPAAEAASPKKGESDEDSAAAPRPARRASSTRAKPATHKPRTKPSTRTSAPRVEKAVSASPRVLPLPEPSERQRRRTAPAPESPGPLNLAPDPYDNDH
ncbi:MAG TPA: serine/threonine-protein kinase [Polyangiaceae bacterium]|nr:serine/threonine-protein kinase [Polyangiaceae bacterium]